MSKELSISDHLHLMNSLICQMMKRGDIKTSAVQELFTEVDKVRDVAKKHIGEYIDKVFRLEYKVHKLEGELAKGKLGVIEGMIEKKKAELNEIMGVN